MAWLKEWKPLLEIQQTQHNVHTEFLKNTCIYTYMFFPLQCIPTQWKEIWRNERMAIKLR